MPSFRTPIGILSFPVLFSPRPRAVGQDPSYQCVLIFDQAAQADPAWTALQQAVRDCIDEKVGPGKSQDRAFMAGLRLPFRPCDEKQYKGYDVPGGKFISAWTKTKPGLVDAQRNEIMVPEDIWAGQLARATVSPFYYHNSGNRGVSFGLNNLQICGAGTERLDGRKAAKDDFPDYDGPGALVTADDEIPF